MVMERETHVLAQYQNITGLKQKTRIQSLAALYRLLVIKMPLEENIYIRPMA